MRPERPTLRKRTPARPDGPLNAPLEIMPATLLTLGGYASVPVAFRVESVVDVSAALLDGSIRARPNARPFVKNYDTIRNHSPADWAPRLQSTASVILVARRNGERLGGAIVVMDTPGAPFLDGNLDDAVLWDVRVAPEHRHRGIGIALFAAAEAAARDWRARSLKVETQDINVPACRLYARMGCRLERAEPNHYPEFMGESRLVWSKSLLARTSR